MTIIGISPDVRQQNPSETTSDPLVFIPYRFENYRGMAIVMRTDGSPVSLAGALRKEVQQLDQDLPLYDVDGRRRGLWSDGSRCRPEDA